MESVDWFYKILNTFWKVKRKKYSNIIYQSRLYKIVGIPKFIDMKKSLLATYLLSIKENMKKILIWISRTKK